jgi:hypothetical protein
VFDGKFYITILDFKKGGLGDFHGIGQVFLGVATNIAQFAHFLAQFVLQGVVHEAWSIVLRTFDEGGLPCKYNSITIKHASLFAKSAFYSYRA